MGTIYKNLRYSFHKSIQILPPRLACIVFNANSSASGISTFARVENDNIVLFEQDSGLKWHIPILLKTRLSLFTKGITNRGSEIAEQYGVSRINIYDNDIVVDCGANLGDLAIYFESTGKRVRYFAFEPGDIEFMAMQKNLTGLRHITPKGMKVCLSNIDGETDFYYAPLTADSSMMDPGIECRRTKVKCRRLDKVLQGEFIKQGEERVRLIKIEAEGLEPEVTEGASEILKLTEYIACDLSPERGIEQLNTVTQTLNLLTDVGFRLLSFNHERVRCVLRNTNIARADKR